MHFAKAYASTALSSFILTSATPVHDKYQADVACHTSNNSPFFEDVADVVNQLYNQGGNCPNGINPPVHCASICSSLYVAYQFADKEVRPLSGGTAECYTLAKNSTAAIQLCGERLQTSDLTCDQVADYANQVKQMCQSQGLTEGTAKVGDGSKWVVVGHS
ncbi:hypothetical protein PG999_009735 [Apiospora kogelbergensis]|uniref:Uncharacterized protein n=1 Tax=Apiospora kogelbergensis TaxID=1337665 RepID=A0AAW0QMC6_9PEZI